MKLTYDEEECFNSLEVAVKRLSDEFLYARTAVKIIGAKERSKNHFKRLVESDLDHLIFVGIKNYSDVKKRRRFSIKRTYTSLNKNCYY